MVRYSRVFSRRASVAAFAAAVASFAGPGIAGAAPTGQSGGEIRDYWTAERMANALPGDELLADNMPLDPVLGALGIASGGPATRGATQEVSNPSKKGTRTHGKVFFTLGALNYVCSGTVVRSKKKSLVATAGHCTYSNTDGYASNFMFNPAHDNGPSRFGRWTATKLKAAPGWESSEDIRYDAAFATMGKRNGEKIQNVVGARRIAFGQGRNLNFDIYGYPAEDPYDGRTMQKCQSPAQGTDTEQNDPRPTRVDCDQTGGSSGGGWVINGNTLNSVVSYGYDCIVIILPCGNPQEGKLFGPYFGSQIKGLYQSQKR